MINQKELKKLLRYDPNTGIFIWIKKTCLKVVVGKTAGTLSAKGYIVITIRGKLYRAHRLAWLDVYGVWPKDQIDHINHIKDDNRIENLREASQQDNCKNRSISKANKSGVIGVSWVKEYRSWKATAWLNGKAVSLGQFRDKFDAICARKSFENKHGYHENHGL